MNAILKYFILLCVLSGLQNTAVADDETPDSIHFEFLGMTLLPQPYSTQIIWKVQGEQTGFNYVIEKTNAQNRWIERSRISSQQSDTTYQEYNQAISDKVESPVEHYRLKRIDPSGEMKILDSATLYHQILSKMDLMTPPGQANKSVTVEFVSLLDTPVRLTIEDINGNIHYEKELEALKGENWHTIKLAKIKPGRYIIVVRDGNENKVQKALVVY